MKYFIKLLLPISLILINCTTEEDEFNYAVNLKNSSDVGLNLKGYNSALNRLEYDFDLESMTIGGKVNYTSPSFGGYVSDADSLIFTFPNNKGYICVVRNAENSDTADEYCFLDKSPFDSTSFQDLGNNTFEFVITQDDFDNAHDLP